jgi:hypothetical protein
MRTCSLRETLDIAAFVLVIGAFCVLNRVVEPPLVSQSERRLLAGMPKLTLESVSSAEFMEGFESYAADSFALRDSLRSVRALTVFYGFLQTDKTGLYLDNSVGAGKFEAADEAKLRQAAAKIRRVAGDLDGINVYCAFIPDKDVFAERDYPGFDPEAVSKALSELDGIPAIDLTDALGAEDYYRTDLHWNQPRLAGVCGKLGEAMGFSFSLDEFSPVSLGRFQGVYAGQIALPIGYDEMLCLEPQYPPAVQYYDAKAKAWEDGELYDRGAVAGRDPYDAFLGGSQPLVIIENAYAETERTLYLFRDSFSSSLAPLLTRGYRKIALIDLRYISFSLAADVLRFERGADALFLYSSLVLNNPVDLLAGQ